MGHQPRLQAAVFAKACAHDAIWASDPSLTSWVSGSAMRPPPDIVLVEIGSSGSSGFEAIHKGKALWPAAPLVALSCRSDAAAVVRAISEGASGYLVEPFPADDLLGAIADAVAGRRVFCQKALSAMVDLFCGAGSTAPMSALTAREQQVMSCLLRGLHDKDIGLELGIETATVNAYLKRIFRKLHVHDRRPAVEVAFAPAP